jgi:hypothetical protein
VQNSNNNKVIRLEEEEKRERSVSLCDDDGGKGESRKKKKVHQSLSIMWLEKWLECLANLKQMIRMRSLRSTKRRTAL